MSLKKGSKQHRSDAITGPVEDRQQEAELTDIYFKRMGTLFFHLNYYKSTYICS